MAHKAQKMLSAVACGVLAAATMLVGAGSAAAATPIGHVDQVQYDIKYQTISVVGWAGDADAGSAPIRVHIYIDGVGAAATSTSMTRTDVARVHPNLGLHTGFYAEAFQPKGRGTHNVCAYGINVGAGGNALLGCRTVVVTEPGALLGHIDHIRVDPGDPAQRIADGWVLDPYDAVSPTRFALVQASGPTNDTGSFFYLDVSAGLPRPDVDRVHPANGHNHGFSLRFRAADVSWAATAQICVATDGFVPGWIGNPTPYCITYPG